SAGAPAPDPGRLRRPASRNSRFARGRAAPARNRSSQRRGPGTTTPAAHPRCEMDRATAGDAEHVTQHRVQKTHRLASGPCQPIATDILAVDVDDTRSMTCEYTHRLPHTHSGG